MPDSRIDISVAFSEQGLSGIQRRLKQTLSEINATQAAETQKLINRYGEYAGGIYAGKQPSNIFGNLNEQRAKIQEIIEILQPKIDAQNRQKNIIQTLTGAGVPENVAASHAGSIDKSIQQQVLAEERAQSQRTAIANREARQREQIALREARGRAQAEQSVDRSERVGPRRYAHHLDSVVDQTRTERQQRVISLGAVEEFVGKQTQAREIQRQQQEQVELLRARREQARQEAATREDSFQSALSTPAVSRSIPSTPMPPTEAEVAAARARIEELKKALADLSPAQRRQGWGDAIQEQIKKAEDSQKSMNVRGGIGPEVKAEFDELARKADVSRHAIARMWAEVNKGNLDAARNIVSTNQQLQRGVDHAEKSRFSFQKIQDVIRSYDKDSYGAVVGAPVASPTSQSAYKHTTRQRELNEAFGATPDAVSGLPDWFRRINRQGALEAQAAIVNTIQALASGMNPLHVAMMESTQLGGAAIQGNLITFKQVLDAIQSPIGMAIAGMTTLTAAIGYLAYQSANTAISLRTTQGSLALRGGGSDTVTSLESLREERGRFRSTFRNYGSSDTDAVFSALNKAAPEAQQFRDRLAALVPAMAAMENLETEEAIGAIGKAAEQGAEGVIRLTETLNIGDPIWREQLKGMAETDQVEAFRQALTAIERRVEPGRAASASDPNAWFPGIPRLFETIKTDFSQGSILNTFRYIFSGTGPVDPTRATPRVSTELQQGLSVALRATPEEKEREKLQREYNKLLETQKNLIESINKLPREGAQLDEQLERLSLVNRGIQNIEAVDRPRGAEEQRTDASRMAQLESNLETARTAAQHDISQAYRVKEARAAIDAEIARQHRAAVELQKGAVRELSAEQIRAAQQTQQELLQIQRSEISIRMLQNSMQRAQIGPGGGARAQREEIDRALEILRQGGEAVDQPQLIAKQIERVQARQQEALETENVTIAQLRQNAAIEEGKGHLAEAVRLRQQAASIAAESPLRSPTERIGAQTEGIQERIRAQEKFIQLQQRSADLENRFSQGRLRTQTSHLNLQVEQGDISPLQAVQAERQLTSRVVEEQATRLSAIVNNADASIDARIDANSKLADLYEQDAQNMIEAQIAATRAIRQENEKRTENIKNFFKTVESGMADAFAGALSGEKSFAEGLKDLRKNAISSFTKELFNMGSKAVGSSLASSLGVKLKEGDDTSISSVLAKAVGGALGLTKDEPKVDQAAISERMQQAGQAQVQAGNLMLQAAREMKQVAGESPKRSGALESSTEATKPQQTQIKTLTERTNVQSYETDEAVGEVTTPSVVPKVSSSSRVERALDIIERDESGGRNIHQGLVDPSISSAQGNFQITNTTWKEFAPKDVFTQYPTAMKAPYDVQRDVARNILTTSGVQHWSGPWQPKLRESLKSEGFPISGPIRDETRTAAHSIENQQDTITQTQQAVEQGIQSGAPAIQTSMQAGVQQGTQQLEQQQEQLQSSSTQNASNVTQNTSETQQNTQQLQQLNQNIQQIGQQKGQEKSVEGQSGQSTGGSTAGQQGETKTRSKSETGILSPSADTNWDYSAGPQIMSYPGLGDRTEWSWGTKAYAKASTNAILRGEPFEDNSTTSLGVDQTSIQQTESSLTELQSSAKSASSSLTSMGESITTTGQSFSGLADKSKLVSSSSVGNMSFMDSKSARVAFGDPNPYAPREGNYFGINGKYNPNQPIVDSNWLKERLYTDAKSFEVGPGSAMNFFKNDSQTTGWGSDVATGFRKYADALPPNTMLSDNQKEYIQLQLAMENNSGQIRTPFGTSDAGANPHGATLARMEQVKSSMSAAGSGPVPTQQELQQNPALQQQLSSIQQTNASLAQLQSSAGMAGTSLSTAGQSASMVGPSMDMAASSAMTTGTSMQTTGSSAAQAGTQFQEAGQSASQAGQQMSQTGASGGGSVGGGGGASGGSAGGGMSGGGDLMGGIGQIASMATALSVLTGAKAPSWITKLTAGVSLLSGAMKMFGGSGGGGGSSGGGGGLGGIFSLASGLFGLFEHGGIIPSAEGGMIVSNDNIVSAAGGMLASAGAGYGVDGRGGRPAIFHPREMVLPARLSDGLQNIITSRQTIHTANNNSSPVYYGDTHNNSYGITVSSIDSRSGAQWLMANRDSVFDALSAKKRNFGGAKR